MYLELSITNGEGYVSTFSAEGKSLECKPTASFVIEDMVQDYEKNPAFKVTSFGSSDGNQRHVVKEVVNRKYNTDGANEKGGIEYNRYKQDCRKEALDLANGRMPYVTHEGGWLPTQEQIKSLADELYIWLISIPNE